MGQPKKDAYIEKALALMNGSLVGSEEFLIEKFDSPALPILFVVGAQRSGTTMLTQALATLYHISYPSNLIARFWRAPYLGALISHSLNVSSQCMTFRSDFGATVGPAGPHEFSYFWRHWFPDCAQNAKPWNLAEAQAKLLRKHMAAWQSVGDEPLLFKNLLEVIPNIQVLAEILPTAVFLNILREDLYVVQSTYESRIAYAGDPSTWFGVRPSNHEQVTKTADPLMQVTEQVHYVKRDIANALGHLPAKRYLNLSYEELVTNPAAALTTIEAKTGLQRWRRNDRDITALDLRVGNKVRLDYGQLAQVKARLVELSAEDYRTLIPDKLSR